MAEIKYVGLDDLGLDTFQERELRKNVELSAEKIQRAVNNELELVVHIKAYETDGKQKKFSIHIRATYPGDTIVSDKQHDWNVLTAVQRALEAVQYQAENKFSGR